MTLKVVMGYGAQYEKAVTEAVTFYNEIEGRKTFHYTVTAQTLSPNNNPIHRCEIWFTLHEPIQPVEQNQFIGSTGIDPSDPNWQDKWNTLNAQAVDQFVATVTAANAHVEPSVQVDIQRNNDSQDDL